MYEFEYSKNGYLFKYLETSGSSISMFCTVSGSTMIKYESDGEYKSFFEYVEPIKMLHRFDAEESWLTIVIEDKREGLEDFLERKFLNYYNKNEYSYPTLKKRILLENDSVYDYKTKFDLGLINKWKNLVNF